ncbi:hypothetical protein D3C80_1891140 [compost metagenome]
MSHHQHLPVLVLPGVLFHVLQQLFGLGNPLVLPQTISLAVLHAHLGHDPQRPQ